MKKCLIVQKKKIKIKSLLFSLNTLSGVTSERYPSLRLCAKAHTFKVATVASRWQRVGNLIGSGFEPHTSRIQPVCLIVNLTYQDRQKFKMLLFRMCILHLAFDFMIRISVYSFCKIVLQ